MRFMHEDKSVILKLCDCFHTPGAALNLFLMGQMMAKGSSMALWNYNGQFHIRRIMMDGQTEVYAANLLCL